MHRMTAGELDVLIDRLTVIQGQADLALGNVHDGSPVRVYLLLIRPLVQLIERAAHGVPLPPRLELDLVPVHRLPCAVPPN